MHLKVFVKLKKNLKTLSSGQKTQKNPKNPKKPKKTQICHRCRWHRWSTFSCEYLSEFSKKFETALMVYSGLGGNWFMKKTRSKKSRDTVPLTPLWKCFSALYTFCVIKSLQYIKYLKTGRVTYLGLEPTMHVIECQIHLVRQSLKIVLGLLNLDLPQLN